MTNDLLAAGREVIRKNLTWGASGNLSARVSETEFLISASGDALDRLEPDCLIRCDLNGAKLEGERRPSVETGMHAGIYRRRADVGAVLHASPFYTTMVASSSLDLDPNLTTDTAYYVRAVRRVPFRSPGSAALAEAAAREAKGANVLLLDNHGALTLGATPAEAVTRMEALELLCRMAVYGHLGIPFRPLGAEDVETFLRELAGHGAV
ncbi:MAG: class II aldolase/adducin family protein [Chloroflexi bacterium]|nr:class II aldolase/adducin family protein [Chloroflexota bacterium]